MTARSIDGLVREMADRESIRDLASLYAHYVWTRDVPALIDLFTEDGEMDTGDRPVIRGREALLQAYQGMLGPDQFHPFVHNHIIDLDGDRATGICHLDLQASVDGRSMIGSGYYEDQYAKVGGKWKFRSRRLTMCYFVPLSEGWAEQQGEG
jgi:ketosteroid isomerase-like protein